MSKFQKKSSFNAKGVLYIENGVISVENEDTGELIKISEHLDEFNGHECTVSIGYVEDVE